MVQLLAFLCIQNFLPGDLLKNHEGLHQVPKHFPFGNYIRYQNIFLLANTFAKRENVRLGQSPIGTRNEEFSGTFYSGLSLSLNIPNSNICETRLYFEFTATNRMSGKNLWAEILWPKVGKVGYF